MPWGIFLSVVSFIYIHMSAFSQENTAGVHAVLNNCCFLALYCTLASKSNRRFVPVVLALGLNLIVINFFFTCLYSFTFQSFTSLQLYDCTV